MIVRKQVSSKQLAIRQPSEHQLELRVRPELVPSPLWGKSGSNLLSRQAWGAVRQSELEKAHHCCAVCSNSGPHLICHEQWLYDDDRKTATLNGFEIHCRNCDLVTHWGRAKKHGMEAEAIAQFCSVNQAMPDQAKRAYRQAFALWQQRSKVSWSLRVAESVLQQYPQLSALVALANKHSRPNKMH